MNDGKDKTEVDKADYVAPTTDKERELRAQLATFKTGIREVPRDSIDVGVRSLGEGVMGLVTDGAVGAEKVAIKQLRPDAEPDMVAHFLQEILIMRQFRHINIARVVGYATSGDPILLILERCDESLVEYLKRKKDMVDTKVRMRLGIDVSRGVSYLANSNLVHRDLSARNVLLQRMTCKITDFGMACPLSNSNAYYKSKGGRIPLRWAALEVINYGKFSTASDVWSLAVIFYEIFSEGSIPYRHASNRDIPALIERGYRLPPGDACPLKVYRLMLACWDADKSVRPKALNVCRQMQLIARSHDFTLAESSMQPLGNMVMPSYDVTEDEAYEYTEPPPPPARASRPSSVEFAPPVPNRPSRQSPAGGDNGPPVPSRSPTVFNVAEMEPPEPPGRPSLERQKSSDSDYEKPVIYTGSAVNTNDSPYREADAPESSAPDYSTPVPRQNRSGSDAVEPRPAFRERAATRCADPIASGAVFRNRAATSALETRPVSTAGGALPAPTASARMRLALDAQAANQTVTSAGGTAAAPAKIRIDPTTKKPSMNSRIRLSLAAQGHLLGESAGATSSTPASSSADRAPRRPSAGAHPIDAWLIPRSVSRDVCTEHLIRGGYSPGVFLVREKSPGVYALSMVYRPDRVEHLIIKLHGGSWSLGDQIVPGCTSLTDLISRLYNRVPELEWTTPLSGPPSAETLAAIANSS